MYSRAIKVIESYIYDLKEPRMNLTRTRNSQRIYSRWAAEEVLGYVIYRKDIPPTQAVEEFMHKMDSYASLNSKNSYIFSVAYDIAADILDLLICI